MSIVEVMAMVVLVMCMAVLIVLVFAVFKTVRLPPDEKIVVVPKPETKKDEPLQHAFVPKADITGNYRSQIKGD